MPPSLAAFLDKVLMQQRYSAPGWGRAVNDKAGGVAVWHTYKLIDFASFKRSTHFWRVFQETRCAFIFPDLIFPDQRAMIPEWTPGWLASFVVEGWMGIFYCAVPSIAKNAK